MYIYTHTQEPIFFAFVNAMCYQAFLYLPVRGNANLAQIQFSSCMWCVHMYVLMCVWSQTRMSDIFYLSLPYWLVIRSLMNWELAVSAKLAVRQILRVP